MQQVSMFDAPQQGTGDAQNPSEGLPTPSAYTELQDHPRPQRRARARSAQENVDQLRRRVASLTDEIDGQGAIRDDLQAHLARSGAGKVDEVWLEALIRMGAIPLEVAAEGDDSEPTYFIEDGGCYCPAVRDEVQLHIRELTEEVERLTEARTMSQRELEDLLRLTSAT